MVYLTTNCAAQWASPGIPGGKTRPTIVHIQDIHANSQAQADIQNKLRQLMDRDAVGLVALEGAFGPLDLSWLRSYPHQRAVRTVADYLLRENKITGPIRAALQTRHPPPFVGVDDKNHYDANVDAYRRAVHMSEITWHRYDLRSRQISADKQQIFSPTLRAFDARMTAYHRGTLSWESYVREMAAHTPLISATIKTALATIAHKRQQDPQRVDVERLLNDSDAMEKAVYEKLADTPAQRRLVALSRNHELHGKLLNFTLSPTEWRDYKSANSVTGSSSDPFETFYLEAERRDRAMSDNFMKALATVNAPVAVLVTGGFHANGIDSRLRDQGYRVVSYTPTVNVEAAGRGANYLNSLTGDNIFLSAPPLSKPGPTRAIVELTDRLQITGQTSGNTASNGAIYAETLRAPDLNAIESVRVKPRETQPTFGITGVTGAIGARLADHLLSVGEGHVRGITRTLQTARTRTLSDRGASLVESDLFDLKALTALVQQSDTVIHLGAWANTQPTPSAASIFATNIAATALLTRLAKAHNKRLIFASSEAVYFLDDTRTIQSEDGPTLAPALNSYVNDAVRAYTTFAESDENYNSARAVDFSEKFLRSHPVPLPEFKLYSLSKLIAERIVHAYGNSISLRLMRAYGPGDETMRRIPKLFAEFTDGSKQTDPVVVANEQLSFVYIDKIVNAFMAAASLKLTPATPRIFNIGDENKPVPLELVAKTIQALTGSARPIALSQIASWRFVPTTYGHAREILQLHEPDIDMVKEGLPKTIEWLGSNASTRFTSIGLAGFGLALASLGAQGNFFFWVVCALAASFVVKMQVFSAPTNPISSNSNTSIRQSIDQLTNEVTGQATDEDRIAYLINVIALDPGLLLNSQGARENLTTQDERLAWGMAWWSRMRLFEMTHSGDLQTDFRLKQFALRQDMAPKAKVLVNRIISSEWESVVLRTKINDWKMATRFRRFMVPGGTQIATWNATLLHSHAALDRFQQSSTSLPVVVRVPSFFYELPNEYQVQNDSRLWSIPVRGWELLPHENIEDLDIKRLEHAQLMLRLAEIDVNYVDRDETVALIDALAKKGVVNESMRTQVQVFLNEIPGEKVATTPIVTAPAAARQAPDQSIGKVEFVVPTISRSQPGASKRDRHPPNPSLPFRINAPRLRYQVIYQLVAELRKQEAAKKAAPSERRLRASGA
jgi:nucleoside-diphosphate-sugar epimerase